MQGDAPSCWLCSSIAAIAASLTSARAHDIVQPIVANASVHGQGLQAVYGFSAIVRLVEPMQSAPLRAAHHLCTSDPMEPTVLIIEVNNLLPIKTSDDCSA